MLFLILISGLAWLGLCLWQANRAINNAPPEAERMVQKNWTKQEVEEAYRKAQSSPTDVKPYLFSKKDRRYIVTGGSGLVGGWIVHHLLMRGEDPKAIRIVDLSPTKRQEAIDAKIDFVRTDVTDPEAVAKAFQKPWADNLKARPLTVFHCVAYIFPSDRKADFSPIYVKVNIVGTKNVLKVAKAAGASTLVATSSASIGLVPPSYFPWPWQRWPKNIYQFLPNSDREKLDEPLEAFCSCYAWSKAQAEKMVRDANDPSAGFLTGAIRPGHAIYGHGVENSSSISWDYLQRGGSRTWIANVVAHFVNAQNVSISHLAYEDALINKTNAGGKAYCVTDPNPPIHYGNLYAVLEQLAHPLTPMRFPRVQHVFMLLLAYGVEAYVLLRFRYLKFLPPLTGDILFCQPGMFNMCTLHIVYTDTAAQEEIGYRAPIQTLDGFCLAVADWNRKVEEKAKRKIERGERGDLHVQDRTAVPKGPNVH